VKARARCGRGLAPRYPLRVLPVRAGPAARSRVFPAAGVELDSSRRTATRHGHPLDLSVKEFAMLED